MKRKLTITLVGILAIGTLAIASPMKFKDCHRKDIMYHTVLFEKLDLSDAQKNEIAQIRKANLEQRQAMVGANRVNFSAYLTEKGFNKTQFIKDKLAKEEMKTAKMANNFEKIFNILTPAQKTEFIKLQKDRESKMQMMMKSRALNKPAPNMPMM
jgi:protein CpxP